MLKKVLGLFLVTLLTASAIPVFASFNQVDENTGEGQGFSIFYEYFEEGFEPDFEAQRTLLLALIMHYPSELMEVSPILSFMEAEDYTVMPNVVLVAFPDTEDGNFLVAIDTEPTLEAIQFILDFTGIYEERIEVLHFESYALEIYDGVIETLDNGFYSGFLEN